MKIEGYFDELGKKVDIVYNVAKEAREKGLDPKKHVEIPLAKSLAERVIGLISNVYPQLRNNDIVEFIGKLEKEYGKLDPAVCLKVAEEIALEKFCKFENKLQAIDAGIRMGIAYLTLGVVSSPIEGFTELKLGKRKDGKEYFSPYYSGPIRSAGGTGSAFSLVIVDHLREIFGYGIYDPDEQEVKRSVTEVLDYHERITNLQYLPSEEEIIFLASNLPVQINGEPSEDKEVSNYKDLARIDSNLIRGGFCLVFAEGISQKAPKVWNMIRKLRSKGFKLTDWDFLEKFVLMQKKLKEGKKADGAAGAVYIQDIVAGRPVFGHPSRSGGFRLRYGRARVSGYSALSIHPATMFLLDSFIAVGGQLKTEKPTKGAAMSSCDSIDGPIVKLKDGSVKYICDVDVAKKIYKDVDEIIYLGDILVPYGDFANRNHVLLKPGYIEEWWWQELLDAGFKEEIDYRNVKLDRAISLSTSYNIPLHPGYIFYWREISYDELVALIDWISHGMINKKILLPYNKTEKERFHKGKRALEILGVAHSVSVEHVIIEGDTAEAFLVNFGLEKNIVESENLLVDNLLNEFSKKLDKDKEVLTLINENCKYTIRDKSGSFIGSRMGRPEKAKLRKLIGSPHALFPVGAEGGRLRSVQESVSAGFVKADFPLYYCDKCAMDSIYTVCERCNNETIEMYYCPECKQKMFSKCSQHDKVQRYTSMKIDSKHYFTSAIKKLGMYDAEVPVLVKGVRGTSSANHQTENLAKGILRAYFSINVNKDGTIRYDATELPITHFNPKEIGTSVEKIRALGYEYDVYGKEALSDEQIFEIFPHDVILPACPESLDEKADDVFIRISKFVDELLKRVYGLKSFYNVSKREDLVGHLVACIAPHNCASVVGRIIGFSKTSGLLASPYMHAAMRRDCLAYDSYVAVQENNQWKINKIGEFIEEKRPENKVDFYGTLGKKMNNIYTWSNPGKGPVKEITKHQPTDMVRIYLEDGRKIETTSNHKIFLKGKTMKRAGELNIGDKLMVSYKRDIEERDILEMFLPEIFQDKEGIMLRNVREYLEKFEKLNKHDNFYQRDSYPIKFVRLLLEKYGKSLRDLPLDVMIARKQDNVGLPISIPLDEKLLEVIGLYIAEGFLRKNDSKKGFYQLSIAGNEDIKGIVKEVFNSHFKLKPSYENKDSVTFSSRLIYDLFDSYLRCGKIAKEKRIPSILLNLKKEKIAALLRGYFEGDGSVSSSDIRISCDSVSEGLKHDLSFVLSRFGIYTKFYEYEKEPGPKVKEFYIRKNRAIPKFKITKIIIPSNFVKLFQEIGFISRRKKEILNNICKRKPYGMKIEYDEHYAYPKVSFTEKLEKDITYCFNVESEHNFFANDILVKNCDGDEAAFMLLLEMLINFSMEFIPSHKGGTQDCPLVLNAKISAGEVDDMIFDLDVEKFIPLALYNAACEGKMPYEVKLEQVRDRVGKEEFSNLWFTHNTSSIDSGVLFSSYKKLPTMQEKVNSQMELVRKIRAVDTSDVARLIIERHFIRDIRGNLRKFSQQQFRCVKCNQKYRRPPLTGVCKCGGKLIFTISEGSIIKYLEPAILLAENFNVPAYVKQSLDLTKAYIESIFGRVKEKQEGLGKWI